MLLGSEKSQEAGINIPESKIPFFRYLYGAGSEDQARQYTETRLISVADIMQWRRTIDQGSEVYHRKEDWRRTRREEAVTNQYLVENRAIIGTPG